MDDVGRYLWSAGIAFVLIFIAMFFSAAETAVSACSLGKLRKMSEEGDRKAKKLAALKEHEMSFCLSAGAAALLCMLGAAVLAMYAFVPPLEGALSNWFEESPLWAHGLALAIGFLLIGFLVMLFGYTLPRKLTMYQPEKVAFSMIPAIGVLHAASRPFLFFPLWTTDMIVKISGYDPNREEEEITEDEIRLMVDTGNEKGTIEYAEREMINNVFEFDDRTVGEVMTHRTDISAVPKDGKIADVLKIAIEEGFSRIPVYDDDIDDIIGIIYAKDLLGLAWSDDIERKKIADYMRDVIYVPESTRCGMLFRQFKQSKVHMAVIVDEYGGTAGIATMEDLLESIVGNIQDEYDQETDEIEKLDENRYSFDGSVSVEKVEEIFDTDLGADEDTDTLGGLIANTLGRIPNDGEMPDVEIGGIRFTVLVAEDRRIVRVEAEKLLPPEDRTAEEGE